MTQPYDIRQALKLYLDDDLIALGMRADAVRRRLHPEGLVTYSLEPVASDVSRTIVFKAGEDLDAAQSRLTALREYQEETRSVQSVVPVVEGTAVEYLKLLALTRISLDNVPYIGASWSQGAKVCQLALRFGANDISGAEASSLRATEEEIRRLIRDSGFVPKERDPPFRTYFLN